MSFKRSEFEKVETSPLKEEDFKEFQEFVKKIYEANGPNQESIDEFNRHNEIVWNYCQELTEQENLTSEELEILRCAAIFHDVSKFNVSLVKHGWKALKLLNKN